MNNHLETRRDRNQRFVHFLIGLAIMVCVGLFLVELANRKYERWIADCQEVLELDLEQCEALWSLK